MKEFAQGGSIMDSGSISNMKLSQVQLAASYSVFKKCMDAESVIANDLISQLANLSVGVSAPAKINVTV